MCAINNNHMIYGSWDMEHDKQNFLLFWTIFFCLLSCKSKLWKNEKNAWRYYHSIHECHKWKSCDVWFLRYGGQQPEFVLILDLLMHFYSLNPKNQNFEKMKKKKQAQRYYHFTHVYHKWKSYDVRFLRYGAWKIEFFVILVHFFAFTLLTTKNSKFWKNKKTS